ncbi:hypothetical protein BDE02_01G222000 [Populus trichocarpa]|jgi:hypothetical protein|nr:hypothetical protein BDE02_01G222000 [Populus trichocarpa]
MGIPSCAWGYRLLHVTFLFSHFSIIYRGILILIYRANLASSVLVSMQGTGDGLFSGKEASRRGTCGFLIYTPFYGKMLLIFQLFCVESEPKHVKSCGNLGLINICSFWWVFTFLCSDRSIILWFHLV